MNPLTSPPLFLTFSDATCKDPCPGDSTATCGAQASTGDIYASYYNISTLPPPRETIAAAAKAHPAATCTSMPQVEFTGTPIEVFEDFANAEACCELCGLSKECFAWTATPTWYCALFDSTVGQLRLSSSESATSGYVEGALTHFRNPRSSNCLSDETAYAVQELGLAATWCSKQCSTDADCPFDVPLGSTAKPRCLLQEPFKNMKRCVLVCTAKSDCGGGQDALCMQTQHFDGVSICTYVNDEVSQKITEPRFVGTFSDQLLPGGTLGNTANRDLPITFCSNGTGIRDCLADSRVSGLNLYGASATSTLPRMHAIHKRRFLTKRCALLPYACSPPTSHSSRRWLSGLKISGTIPPNVANMTQLGEMYVFLLRYHLPHRAAELSRAHFSSRHSLFLSSHDVSFSYHIVLLSHSRRMSGNAISGTIPNEFVALKKMSIL